ncbi:hypothetical protein Palpr_0460 [Paludibacter propionicigenes WB4]|uniref:Uncharacterized protein n=1 Tax=Paludibacter propionicigenes (strain DSM 17365 / JCM 13257 / WB4) TaxID=694427 RepID=E4T1M6_PALPW|nr:hypothetical protein Palpr_0460 [Paludibacter propionicigenes WB4]
MGKEITLNKENYDRQTPAYVHWLSDVHLASN